MTKDVMISIKGMLFDVAEEAEDLEVIQPGQYYKRGDMHYLIYDEPVEGTDEVTKNMIKFNDNCMTLTRKGMVNTTMLFDTKEKNLTNYATPFGNLIIGLDTHNISLNKTEEELSLKINYSLDINYEFLADCNIDIRARELKH